MANDFDASKYSTATLSGFVMSHILQKGFQAGSILGVGLAAPLYGLYKKSWDPLLLSRVMGYTAVGMTGLSGVVALGKFTQIDRAGFEDRAYRLYHSNSQKRTDAFCTVGAVLGVAAAAVLAQQKGLLLQPINLIGGASAGTSIGMLLHVLTKPEDQRSPNQMVNIIKYEATGK